jgi:hypothetical protein
MADEKTESAASGRNKDEIALELMKFIAVTTGYGKGNAGAGFNKGPAPSAEEYAEALLGLYTKCRKTVE